MHLQKKLNPEAAALVASLLLPPPIEPIHRWGERNIWHDRMSATSGKWSSDVTPFVVEQLADFQDKTVRIMVSQGPVQGSKTTPAMIALCWTVQNAAGPTLWACEKDDKAKELSKDRLVPTIEKCDGLKDLFTEDRHDKTIWSVRFKTCTVNITGAHDESNLESTPYRYIFGDECRRWKTGHLQLVKKRTRTYPNSKTWLFSTPGEDGDEFDQEFKAGDRREWFFPCLGCGREIDLDWKQVKWDAAKDEGKDGTWAIDVVAESIRLECKHCAHRHQDHAAVRRHILTAGRWVPQNPNASRERRSYRWNALLPSWIRWRDLVDDFHKAEEAAKLGDLSLLRIFVTESLAKPVNEDELAQMIEIERPPSVKYSLAEIKEDDGDYRVMTVDVQKREFWLTVRAWWKDKHSRLLLPANAKTWGEVAEIAERFKMIGRAARRVAVDSSYDTRNVYENCCRYGWTALNGEPVRDYVHTLPDKTRVRRLYSPRQKGDPQSGMEGAGRRFCWLFMFADVPSKEILHNLINGRGAPWDVADDAPTWYIRGLRAEQPRDRVIATTGQKKREWVVVDRFNHPFDCEKMQVVIASMLGLLGQPSEKHLQDFDNSQAS